MTMFAVYKVRRSAAVAGLFVLLLVILLFRAPTSSAYSAQFCAGSWSGNAVCAWNQRHSLTSVWAHNYYGSYYKVCAGAYSSLGPPATLYGSFICSLRDANHTYGGGNLLYAGLANGEPYGQSIYGTAVW